MPAQEGQLEGAAAAPTPQGQRVGLQNKTKVLLVFYYSLMGLGVAQAQPTYEVIRHFVWSSSIVCWLEFWILCIVFRVGTSPTNTLFLQRDWIFFTLHFQGPLWLEAWRRSSGTSTRGQTASLYVTASELHLRLPSP